MPTNRSEGAAQRANRMEREAKAAGQPSLEDLLKAQDVRMKKPNSASVRPREAPQGSPDEPTLMGGVRKKPAYAPTDGRKMGAPITQMATQDELQAIATDYLTEIRDQWPGRKPSPAQIRRAQRYAEEQLNQTY